MGVAPLFYRDIFRSCRITKREFTLPQSFRDKVIKLIELHRIKIIVKITELFYLLPVIFPLFGALCPNL